MFGRESGGAVSISLNSVFDIGLPFQWLVEKSNGISGDKYPSTHIFVREIVFAMCKTRKYDAIVNDQNLYIGVHKLHISMCATLYSSPGLRTEIDMNYPHKSHIDLLVLPYE